MLNILLGDLVLSHFFTGLTQNEMQAWAEGEAWMVSGWRGLGTMSEFRRFFNLRVDRRVGQRMWFLIILFTVFVFCCPGE
jgi:hypothetical protein